MRPMAGFYLNYTAPGGSFGAGVYSYCEFTVSSDPDVADPGSEAALLTFDQPQNQSQRRLGRLQSETG